MFARVYLWICSAVFLGLAIAFLFWPAPLLANVDLVFETPTAFADIRADYGGCILGIGIFLGWCALRPERVRTGLLCCGLTLLGYASGRILSLAIDGMPKRIIFVLILVEVLGATGCFVLAQLTKNANHAKNGPGFEGDNVNL